MLADLERFGVEFPNALRDEAELLAAEQPGKRCHQCGVRRQTKDFLPTSATPDRLTDRCKPCVFANATRDRAEREARYAARTERTDAHV